MKKINLTVVQVLLWALIFLLLLVYNMKSERPMLGITASVINITIYSATIYLNSLWLMPRFLPRRRYASYVLYSLLIISALVLSKTSVEYFVHHQYFGVSHFYNFGAPHLAMALLSVLLCFIIGGLLYVSIDYIKLYKKQEQLKNQHLVAELNLLKSQVQPHFLFNTLNNIYSLAYVRSDKTAEMVAKLSDIMRYFVEQAPKENVPLTQEIEFLQNYISLESIRMLHPLQLDFTVQVTNPDVPVPPMLFTPFVENVFKHGINKKSKNNLLQICVLQQQQQLHFQIKNRIFTSSKTAEASRTGLSNLHKRLQILYGEQYQLTIDKDGTYYAAQLIIPISVAYALPAH